MFHQSCQDARAEFELSPNAWHANPIDLIARSRPARHLKEKLGGL